MDLKGKVAIVTGASSGLGAAMSKQLVERGATVYGIARRRERLERVRKSLNESPQFIPVQLDMTDSDGLEAWVSKTFSSHSGTVASDRSKPTRITPDILINNAGFGFVGRVEDTSLETWRSIMDVNLNAVFYLTRIVIPMMKRNPSVCHIVNISSVAGLMGNEQLSAYNASKFALRGFTEALFKEVRHDGIKVSCLFPGSIATEFFDNTPMQVHDNMMRAEDVAKTVMHVLQTPDNLLISELTLRPLNPTPPSSSR